MSTDTQVAMGPVVTERAMALTRSMVLAGVKNDATFVIDESTVVTMRRAYGVYTEEWTVSGLRHRDGDMPAVVCISEHATIRKWCVRGALHREHGPAHLKTYPDGREHGLWFRDGIPFAPAHAPTLLTAA